MIKLSLSAIVIFVLVLGLAGDARLIHAQESESATQNAREERWLSGHLSNNQTTAGSQSDSKKRPEGLITGRLLDGSGQPIPNAAVYVRKFGAPGSSNRSIGTDTDGRFKADSLAPGVYSVSAYVPGYVADPGIVDQQYYRPGNTVTLRMVKGAAISGAVTNAAGDPIIAVRVSAVRVRDAEGRPIRGAGLSGSFRQTDDRGVYRLYGLQPGAYLVVVNGGSLSFFPSSAYEGDAPTYYPSTTRDAAAEVTVRLGDEIGGIDIRYRGDAGHIVSGTISGSSGTDSFSRGVSVSLTHVSSGLVESNTYIPLRGGERGFALYGVPEGEYDLVGQIDAGTETAAASPPRRVSVKGSDVTGIDLALAPLGSIAGRVVLERLSESERTPDCRDKRHPLLDETVVIARRDMPKDQFISGLVSRNEAAPDEKGEFKIYGLTAGRYRIEMRLPGENWFVRSVTQTTPVPSKSPGDVMPTGVTVGAGQRVGDLVITVAEGAAALRGKVVGASEGAAVPSKLRVHLVPAETESSDLVLRFFDTTVDNDGGFSISNLAPGRYFTIVRALSDEEFMESSTPRPIVWDASARAKLRRNALAGNNSIDLRQCQRVNDYTLKYTPASGTNKAITPKKP